MFEQMANQFSPFGAEKKTEQIHQKAVIIMCIFVNYLIYLFIVNFDIQLTNDNFAHILHIFFT